MCSRSTVGAKINNGSAISTSANVLTDCLFDSNSAARGGGLYNVADNVQIVRGQFSANWADISGGGIYNHANADNLSISTSSFVDDWTGGDGGAIVNFGTNSSVDNTIFEENVAFLSGGAIATL